MTVEQLFEEFTSGFPRRKFTAGLLVALIDMMLHLNVPEAQYASLDDFYADHPRQMTFGAGKLANTLIVAIGDGKTVSLRNFYDAAERYFRAEQKRFDYPSCAPHATQAWTDYTSWLDWLVSFPRVELESLRKQVTNYVLQTLPSHEFEAGSVPIEQPLFQHILTSFDLKPVKGEPTGAAFQGVVFGFLRADNPHLQVEIDKVRVGSKRLQRVGDIDGWEGARLAISAEVKQYVLGSGSGAHLAGFASEVARRGTLGLVVALGFEDGVRESIEELGLIALDLGDLAKVVELWDPVKQRTAVTSMVYYVQHVEKNSNLAARLTKFVKSASEPSCQ